MAGKALFMLIDDSNGRYRLALLPCTAPWSQRATISTYITFATRKALSDSLAGVSKVANFDLELVVWSG